MRRDVRIVADAYRLDRVAELVRQLQCGRAFVDAESLERVGRVFARIVLQYGRVFVDAESRAT